MPVHLTWGGDRPSHEGYYYQFGLSACKSGQIQPDLELCKLVLRAIKRSWLVLIFLSEASSSMKKDIMLKLIPSSRKPLLEKDCLN